MKKSIIRNVAVKKIVLVLIALLSAWQVNAQQVTLTATSGTATGTFSTLGAAVTAINAGTHKGAIVITINANTTETAQASLSSSGTGSASYTSILIKPAAVTTASVTASFTTVSTAILKLNGADNVTIDGSNNGTTSRDLTFTRTSTTGTDVAIWIAAAASSNGATGNTIKNCNIVGNSAITTGFGILAAGTSNTTSAATAANSNNTIQNNNITKYQNGIVIIGRGSGTFDQNWVIRNNTETALGLRGIWVQNAGNFTVNNNNISNFAAANSSDQFPTSGIQVGLSIAGGNIYNNSIKSINNTAPTFGAAGIYLTATTTSSAINIYNNIINDIWTANGWPSSNTAPDNGYGITIDQGGGYNIYYNTVVLSTSPSGSDGNTSAALNITPSVTAPGSINLKNNILVNNQATNNINRVGLLCQAPASVFASIDNNDYVGNTAMAMFGSAPITAFNILTSSFGGNISSISYVPTFISTTDLHLQVINANIPMKRAAPLGTITTDIDGSARSAVASAIGASEIQIPYIAYAGIPNNCIAADVTFTVAIGDPGVGINTTTNLPQVFFKKNSGSWNHAAGSLISGTATNGIWQFTIPVSALSGLLPLEAVFYFITAQNNSGFVFSNAPGLIASNTTTITTFPAPVSSYVFSVLNGTYHVGVGKQFTTITDAIAAYNTYCIAGPVTFLLDDASYSTMETFPIIINYNAAASATNTLLIKPNVSTTVNIICNPINGAFLIKSNHVTIDGSNTVGGTSQNLTISTPDPNSSYVIGLSSTSSSIGATDNTIKNCIITAGSFFSTGIVSGNITSSSFDLAESPNSNNTISHNNITASDMAVAVYGFPDQGWSIDNNTMTVTANLAVVELSDMAGNFNNNTISQSQSYDGILYGLIVFDMCPGLNISNNNITGIVNTSTSNSSGAYGIYLSVVSGSVNVYNNFISNIVSKGSATIANNAFGIVVADGGGSGLNIYHNSVNMNANETGTAGTSACLYISSAIKGASLMNIKNNIFANTQTGGAVAAKRYAVYNASPSGNAIFTSIDNNDYYTTGTTLGSIIVSGTQTPQVSLADIRLSFGHNASSVSQLPPFVSGTDLHITGSCPMSQFESGGQNVGILNDIDGNPRPGLIPGSCGGGGLSVDIGADEFDGTIQDVVPPAISYSLLSSTCSSGDITLTGVTITDNTGINLTGPLVPQIYFRKNALAYVHVSGTWISGTAKNSVWSFTIPAASFTGGAPAPDDVISYYIAAQDVVTTPNVGAEPSAGFTATNVNTVLTHPVAPNTYIIGRTIGPVTMHIGTGIGTDFTTITQAVNMYNAACLTGPVTFLLDDATYPSETYPITIKNNPSANSVNTLTIKPNTGRTVAISSSQAAGGIFYLSGANYVTIDGSNTAGGTTKNLSITNTSTSTSAISYVVRLSNTGSLQGATNNTIKNCNITGGTTRAAIGVLSGSNGNISITNPAEVPNSGNTVFNNTFSTTSVAIALFGGTIPDVNWFVYANTLSNGGKNGIELHNLSGIVKNNTISGITASTNSALDGILVAGTLPGLSVYSNNINNIVNTSGSSGFAAGAYGIELASASGLINIYNNFISNLVCRGNNAADIAGNAFGIAIDGVGHGYNIYYNTINMNTAETGTAGITAAMYISSDLTGSSLMNVKNNIFANTQTGGASAANRYAIYNAGAAGIFTSIDYNDYSSAGTNLGFLGSALIDLVAIQAGFGGNTHSINVVPAFVGSPDLHLTNIPANRAFQAGIPISSPAITMDIDGNARAVAVPVIGAHEIHIPPVIAYTPLGANTCGNGDIILSGVNIQTIAGVPVSGPNVPQVYFRKNSDAWNHASGTLTPGSTAQNGNWDFTISAAAMGGLTNADQVFYYVIAQDAPTTNIAALPSDGLFAADVNNVIMPPTTPNVTIISIPGLSALTISDSTCFDVSLAHTANYGYGTKTGDAADYTLIWSPTGLLPDVASFISIPASPVHMNVPANTPVGTYTGIVTVKNALTCTNTYTVTLVVNPLPTVTFTSVPSATLCLNSDATYNTQTGKTNYLWTFPGFSSPADYAITSGGGAGDAFVTLKWRTPGTKGVSVNYADPVTGCFAANPAASATSVVLPAPAIHTFIGGGGYCAGDTGVHAGLTLSDAGISYQLYRHDTAVFGPVAGTGSAIDFGLLDTPGVYYAIGTNTHTGCTNYLSGVTVYINPLPDTFSVTGGGSYCAHGTGMSVGLSGSAMGIDYQLYNSGTPVGAPRAGTGDTIDFGLQTLVGPYTVIAANHATHCSRLMGAGSVSVDTLPLPVDQAITGGGPYCFGDTAAHIMLSGSEPGLMYELDNNGTPVDTLTGTGIGLDYGQESVPGTYTVFVTNTGTGCTAMMTTSVTVSMNLLPGVYDVTGGGNYCIGNPTVHVGVNGSDPGIRYNLYLGATSTGNSLLGDTNPLDYGVITATGTYKVLATDTLTGCHVLMNDSAVMTDAPVLNPAVNISAGTGYGDTLCDGRQALLTAQTRYGGTHPGYQWSVNFTPVPGATDSAYIYNPAEHDWITVVLTSDTVCAEPNPVYDTMKVVIAKPQVPSVFIVVNPITTISPGQPDTLTAVTTNCGPHPHYQWYKNGGILPADTSQVYISNNFTSGDSMACRVITDGPCDGMITFNSVIISVYKVDVINVMAGINDIRLIPNPNKGLFTVKGPLGSAIDEEVHLEVTDMLGQVVHSSMVMAKGGVLNEQVQLSNTLANGMYILNLRTVNERKVFHFVIEQ